MQNIWHIISVPDNVPIVLMLLFVIFLTLHAWRLAVRNDRLRRTAGERDKDAKLPVDIMYDPEEAGLAPKIETWPYLVRIELLVAMALTILLIVWSIVLDAPLEQQANPTLTPNPAKAPWYFLGLQEMLVYFDPWIAGVGIPTLIVIGLMVIPYVDVNPKGNGYYTFSERKFAIAVFCFGFIGLWVSLIVIGTFMRGPGWMWFWPWQDLDPHRVVAETNVDFSDIFFGVSSSSAAGSIIGILTIGGYYAVTMLIPFMILKRRGSETLEKLGLIRYTIVSLLLWTMVALPIKMILRLGMHIKYVLVTPWFNI